MNDTPSNARRTGPALEAMYQWLTWLIPTNDTFPSAQKFVLGDRIETIALEVLDHLITATFTKSRDSALASANLGLDRLRFLIRLSQDLRLIDMKRYEHAARGLDDIGRMIGGWKKAHHAQTA